MSPLQHADATDERATGLWLCLHLPRLGLELFTRSLPDGAAARPAVLVEAHRVVQLNAAARARGLAPAMSLATAESICADLAVAWREPEREAAALERLAIWAYRFTPKVTPEPPDALLLEVAGSLKLFRGLDRLERRLLEGIAGLGYSGFTGVAPTPLAARALARAGRSPAPERLAAELEVAGRDDEALRRAWCRAVAGACRPALARLPLGCLDRPEREREKLDAMGLRTLGELLKLPRTPLAHRFGDALLTYLDRLTGRQPDPREPIVPPPTFASTVHFLEDVADVQALAFPMQRLVGELTDWLRVRQLATDHLDWRLIHPRHGEQRIRVRCAAARRDRARFLELSRLQLEREAELPAVGSLSLHVSRLEAHAGRAKGGLFPNSGNGSGDRPGETDGHGDPAALIDLLRARLGDDVCHSVRPADDHRPERAWTAVRPRPPPAHAEAARPRPPRTDTEATRARSSRKDAEAAGAAPSRKDAETARASSSQKDAGRTPTAWAKTPPGPRPLWLVQPPRRLPVRDGTPCWHGPLTLEHGPERIDTGWWSGDDDPPACRDYWVARHVDGGHYWVFREHTQGRWFLHGIFA